MKIAILGFGTVGQGLPILLKKNAKKLSQILSEELEIGKILVRNDEKIQLLQEQNFDYDFVTTIDDVLQDDSIDTVIELMGRIEPAKTYIEQALMAGKNVVTANKDLIAEHGVELSNLAVKQNVALRYEAAVAGGIPILRALSNSLAADEISRVLGILNGTSNFILTKMSEELQEFDDVLQEAQKLGYAESDPTNDVDGFDAGYKLAILSRFAFGMALKPSDIRHSGIRQISMQDFKIAEQLGYTIKLVGDLQRFDDKIFGEISPAFVPKNHALATINGVKNAVFTQSFGLGDSLFSGAGAGQLPTATSVLSDLIEITKHDKKVTTFHLFDKSFQLADENDVKSAYYFNFVTADQQGQFLKLAQLFDTENASFAQVIQEKNAENQAVISVITHEMSVKSHENLKKKLSNLTDFDLKNTFKVLE